MNYNWAAIMGEYELKENDFIFKGKVVKLNNQDFRDIGNFICDQQFGGGKISAEIEFKDNSTGEGCEIIFFYNPQTRYFISAGLGTSVFYTIRTWDTTKWVEHVAIGNRLNLKANIKYKVEVILRGSDVTLRVDNINVASTVLPYFIPQSQVGLWCQGSSNIIISNYNVERVIPKVFVVMQYTTPYNELYEEVIKKVCEDFNLEAIRVDESYGPGIIISDISKQISGSKLIIADITPSNPNVYYEVGYAHALNKPTILIAEKPTELPFDVSPFRILFYENSIRGKSRIEEGLKKHIQAILTEGT